VFLQRESEWVYFLFRYWLEFLFTLWRNFTNGINCFVMRWTNEVMKRYWGHFLKYLKWSVFIFISPLEVLSESGWSLKTLKNVASSRGIAGPLWNPIVASCSQGVEEWYIFMQLNLAITTSFVSAGLGSYSSTILVRILYF